MYVVGIFFLLVYVTSKFVLIVNTEYYIFFLNNYEYLVFLLITQLFNISVNGCYKSTRIY